MILAVIIACEVGFWVAIVLGLTARYLMKMPRLGVALLACAPVVDLVLLIATAVHLRSGADASWEHGLAALYIGFSIAYGHRLIAWADTKFAQRFAGGAAPVKLYGRDYARACLKDLGRTTLAVAISATLLQSLIWWAGDADRTQALTSWFGTLGIIFTIEVIRSVGYTIWPRRAPAAAA
ncbi:hypothetical protein [Agreia sp. COWG]|uniref:hypothetical protein n=1 Tax=Agreia sp. COWG TaxID=2773266 RepID=UPI001925C571|nr:hypothetical protein [Agreia sp. COWG]CAD6009775.1 putative integral inner membrane protein [Agreia sp. COWG]